MRKTGFIVVFIAAIAVSAFASPQKDAIAKFYEYRTRMLGQQGTAADVDALLGLFAEDSTYEHPQFKVSMNKADARRGMLAHLREGKDVSFTVTRMREREGFAVAEVTFRYVVNEKEIVRTGVAIFEFQGRRLARVAEYGQ
jgi:ketosteroid isomerase-like protein